MSGLHERRRPGEGSGRRDAACLGGQPDHNPNSNAKHESRLPHDWRQRIAQAHSPDDYFTAHVSNLSEPNLLGWANATCPFCRTRLLGVQLVGDKGSWRCSGCGLGGDLLGFHQRLTGLAFADAVRDLIGIKPRNTQRHIQELKALYGGGSE